MTRPSNEGGAFGGDRDKILSHKELLARRRAAAAAGKRLVQCHGCFDVVHPGHIRHLRFARSQGDILLVSITGDAEMRKGTGRPLIPEELRAENLAAFDFVDWVYIEQRPTAADLLDEVRPDVYIKGREYEFNADPRFQDERRAVERHGGRVVFSSGDVVFSSTALIQTLEHSADPFHARLVQLAAREELRGPRLAQTIAAFRGRRVVVIGEPILDTYVLCDRPEVAGESPVLTLRPLDTRHYDGGAAVIARHAAALGARPILLAPLPASPAADALRRRLALEGIEVRAIPVRTGLPEKQRFLVGAQKVMKLDLVDPIVLDAAEQDRVVAEAERAVSDAGGRDAAAVIADFGLGFFTPGVTGRLCSSLRRRCGVLTADVSGRRSNLRAMRGLDLACPSESELRDAYRQFDEGLPAVTWRLLRETRSRAALVSLGADGLIAFERLPEADRNESSWERRVRGEHVPALAPAAVDPLGCGDALLATATLALAAGAPLIAAAFLGSVAAAVEVQRLGNVPVSAMDVRQGVARVHAARLACAPGLLESRAGARDPGGLDPAPDDAPGALRLASAS